MSQNTCCLRMKLKSIRTKSLSLIQTVFPFHAAAWKASSEPIRCMLDGLNDNEKDRLTSVWKEATQAQLTTISITSALFGGVIATSFTWPALSRLKTSDEATVVAIWYSALLLAIVSIATSAQQAVALTRLSSHPEGLTKIRDLLGKRSQDGHYKPRKLQLIIWQAPLSLLNTSAVMFVIGLIVFIWKSVSFNWSGDDVKVVTLFTLTLVYATGLYLVSTYSLY